MAPTLPDDSLRSALRSDTETSVTEVTNSLTGETILNASGICHKRDYKVVHPNGDLGSGAPDLLTGKTADENAVNHIVITVVVKSNNRNESENILEADYISKPEKLIALKADVIVPLLTGQPLIGDQSAGIGLQESSQTSYKRAGGVRIVYTQYNSKHYKTSTESLAKCTN
ncbi:hypothetical protein [Synechococcus sp. BIOS-E4-1]|uniref:hypothetical protein n=1 Tax=Synechococcus sp. BIOS-E4-1 TaxID=1400864 RepID=UPI00164566CE|nr:hypothetical protein [Synechococcus sp. BIOS-E4-1]